MVGHLLEMRYQKIKMLGTDQKKREFNGRDFNPHAMFHNSRMGMKGCVCGMEWDERPFLGDDRRQQIKYRENYRKFQLFIYKVFMIYIIVLHNSKAEFRIHYRNSECCITFTQ